jgi:hypothetical protein
LSAEQESVSLVVVAQRSFFFFLIFRTSSLSFSVVELDSLLLTVLATMASIFFFLLSQLLGTIRIVQRENESCSTFTFPQGNPRLVARPFEP